MIFLSVVRNSESQEWEILRVISNPINVRGNLTGITYGDIRTLSLETRIAEGFWTQEDVYENTGEYMEFKEKQVSFDESTAVVTNTYVYQRMALDVIKQDLVNRTKSHRDMLINSGFDYNGNTFDTSMEGRLNLCALVHYVSLNPQVTEVSIPLPTSDSEVVLSSDNLEELFSQMMAEQQTLFTKCVSIKAAIEATTTYEDARAAATWDGTPL